MANIVAFWLHLLTANDPLLMRDSVSTGNLHPNRVDNFRSWDPLDCLTPDGLMCDVNVLAM